MLTSLSYLRLLNLTSDKDTDNEMLLYKVPFVPYGIVLNSEVIHFEVLSTVPVGVR